ncbi:HpcH/HpaI aldolase family protein [Bremerella sp. P1]|uniref:HpcH/HpaI aldolase family protein n=1 Tax=Bremerella sp. P1 TaxID=3026424 RepID=UPI002368F1B4|nr:aldolase/citrate lyase family protein [Bremerella sp. P1]WDI41677.1 aldolase/citrate lyase family protein [Bremerella sp. P1]
MSHDFRKRLRERQTLLGTIVSSTDPASAEVLAECGFDWLFIDAEHGPYETTDLLPVLRAVDHRIPCIVRVPASEEIPIKKTLDIGATGIIAPQTNTVEQVESVVRYCRYSPNGNRGVGLSRASTYGLGLTEYVGSANDEVAVIVQAEHIEAVENIEQIVKVEGVDAIFIGPYDLSASMGKMGEVTAPDVVDAIEHVTKVCDAAKMPLGIFGVSAESVKPYIERGYSLIVSGVDVLMMAHAAKGMLSTLRSSNDRKGTE